MSSVPERISWTPLELLAVLVFVIALLFGTVVRLPQVWNGKTLFPETSSMTLSTLERTLPSSLLMLWLMVAGLVVAIFADFLGPEAALYGVVRGVARSLAIACVPATAAVLAILLVNWPSVLVAPHRRGEPGLLSPKASTRAAVADAGSGRDAREQSAAPQRVSAPLAMTLALGLLAVGVIWIYLELPAYGLVVLGLLLAIIGGAVRR